jgi:hypothetical protein
LLSRDLAVKAGVLTNKALQLSAQPLGSVTKHLRYRLIYGAHEFQQFAPLVDDHLGSHLLDHFRG